MPLIHSLRHTFKRATLKHSLKAAMMAVLITAPVTMITYDMPTPKNNFSDILNAAPVVATPYHQDIFRGFDYTNNHKSAIKQFASICPSIKTHAQTSDEEIAWINKNISLKDFQNAPNNLRHAAYHLATLNQNNDLKSALIYTLQQAIPDSEIYINYVAAKQFEVAQKLQSDPEIVAASKIWNKVTDDNYRIKIIRKIIDINLSTLLPDKKIDMPKVRWATERENPESKKLEPEMGDNNFGLYVSAQNTILINGRLNPSKYTFSFVTDIISHEAFHVFEDVAIGYGLKGYYSENDDLNRFVNVMYQSRTEKAGALRLSKNETIANTGYRLMKHELFAWAWARMGSTIQNPERTKEILGNFKDKLYDRTDAINPLAKAPRLVDAAPQADKNPRAGIIPAACLN